VSLEHLEQPPVVVFLFEIPNVLQHIVHIGSEEVLNAELLL